MSKFSIIYYLKFGIFIYIMCILIVLCLTEEVGGLMARFSEKEITETLSKIRLAYEDGAAKYGAGFYNLEAFNERYRLTLNSKSDVAIFLMAEFQALGDIKSKISSMAKSKETIEKKKQENYDRSFTKKVDDMISDFYDAVTKYPKKFLHEDCDDEISHIYGGLEELYCCFTVVKFYALFRGCDYAVESSFKDIDNRFQQFVSDHTTSKCPQVYSDYIFDLDKHKNTGRAEQFILKEVGFFLHSFLSKLEKLRDIAVRSSSTEKIDFHRDFPNLNERVYKFFIGKSFEEVYYATVLYARAMVTDFRLQSFKKNED